MIIIMVLDVVGVVMMIMVGFPLLRVIINLVVVAAVVTIYFDP